MPPERLSLSRLHIPQNRLWILPAISSFTWFTTLTVLLVSWLARGMPQYPNQSNPYVAFISDIASQDLKPFFVAGGTLTGIFFVASVVAVHIARYDEKVDSVYHEEEHRKLEQRRRDQLPSQKSANSSSSRGDRGEENRPDTESEDNEEESRILPEQLKQIIEIVSDERTKKLLSALTVLAAVIAALALALLGILDTFRFTEAHRTLLMICLAGLAFEAAGTAVLYADEVGPSKVLLDEEDVDSEEYVRLWTSLKVWATLSLTIVIIELVLGGVFVSFTLLESWHLAGILEWITAYFGAIYMFAFTGFLKLREETKEEEEEEHYRAHHSGRNSPYQRRSIDEETPLLSRRYSHVNNSNNGDDNNNNDGANNVTTEDQGRHYDALL